MPTRQNPHTPPINNRIKCMNRPPPPGPPLTRARSSTPSRRTDRAGSVAHGAPTRANGGGRGHRRQKQHARHGPLRLAHGAARLRAPRARVAAARRAVQGPRSRSHGAGGVWAVDFDVLYVCMSSVCPIPSHKAPAESIVRRRLYYARASTLLPLEPTDRPINRPNTPHIDDRRT